MTFLLDCTIKVSLILTIGLATTVLLRRQSAALRHWILAASVLCSALTPVVTALMPAWNLSSLTGVSSLPTAAEAQPGESAAVASENPTFDTPATPVLPAMPGRLPETIWLSGVAIGFAALLVGSLRLARVASFSEHLQSGRWTSLAGMISQRYGLRRPVHILRSRNASILVTWGALRPKVLLPAGAEQWPEERIRVVLSHELAHVRRSDWLVQMMAEILRAVYWFNPLLWIACNRLRQESEYACDDAAIAEGIDGTEYAAHLLELARTLHTGNRAWSGALAMARPSTVERRFKAMLNPALNRLPVTRFAMLAIAIAALCITLPLGSLQSSAQTPQSPQTAGKLSGTVTDANGAAVSGATIIVSSPNGSTEGTAATNATGAFAFAGLPPGTHVLQVFASGFGPSRMTNLELKAGQDHKQDVKMDIGFVKNPVRPTAPAAQAVIPGGNSVRNRVTEESYNGNSIAGVVRDARDLPIPGVDVRVGSASAVTDELGGYRLGTLPSGTYRVSFSLPGFKTLNFDNVEIVNSGKTAAVNAVLQVATMAEELTITPTSSAGPQVLASTSQRGTVSGRGSRGAGLLTGGNVSAAMLLEITRPAYPPEALAARVQGAVIMEGVVGVDGSIMAIKVINGHPLLQQAAIDAVSRWRYRPTLLDGDPIEVVTTITIQFVLGQ